jgi:hypothetical protein
VSVVAPSFFAEAQTARALERSRAAVVLVGSFDGSGNYGDIAQFQAARELVGRLEPGILVLPVLERGYLASLRRLGEEGGVVAPNALFFDPEGLSDDGLLPAPAPADLAFAGAYLYGGGYLNRHWGPRKLAMLAAAESLLEAGGAAVSCRLASGLQVEPEWLAAGGAPGLERFGFLGARDGGSRAALAGLDSGTASAPSGDDAIALLAGLPAVAATGRSGEALRLNLHFAEHEWMGESPGAALDFCAGLLVELGRLQDRPVVVQPLLAYLDERVDERPGLERLRAAAAARGVELEPPLVLRPAALGALAPRLAAAELTLSCSYHAALTSLMLGVPALLVGDSPYYEQKAAGLSEDFGAAAPSASSAADPTGVAAELAALLDPARAGELRAGLAAAAERQRRRRAEAETELLGRLGGAAIAALEERTAAQHERLRLRSAEPAELRERLSAAETAIEKLRGALEESPLEAELRVREARAEAAAAEAELAAILHSRSWRLLSPLRRLRALLSRG